MENNSFVIPPFASKYILRSTGEEVEVIDSEIKERGARSDEDWVTYIDSDGNEHIKEHLNIQLDFKPIVNDTWSKMFDFAKDNKMPTIRNYRIFEVTKELIKAGRYYIIDDAVGVATNLVDKVGIETE